MIIFTCIITHGFSSVVSKHSTSQRNIGTSHVGIVKSSSQNNWRSYTTMTKYRTSGGLALVKTI